MPIDQLAMERDGVSKTWPSRIRSASSASRDPSATRLRSSGPGLIDSIADSDIEAGAKVKFRGFPEIAGRVSRLKDKRIGRFGWKSQTASL